MKQIFALITAAVTFFPWNFPTNPTVAFASENPPVEVKHDPPDYYFPGQMIRLEAEVDGQPAINNVRCYFWRADKEGGLFVKMLKIGQKSYNAVLPAPAALAKFFKYQFLVINAADEAYKTQIYSLRQNDEDEQQEEERRGTEEDSIERSEVYSAEGDPETKLELAKQIEAKPLSGGLSKTTIFIGSGVAVAAAAVGVAAAAGSSDGDSGGGDSPYAGTYTVNIDNVSANPSYCGTSDWTDTWIIGGNGDVSSPDRRWKVSGGFSGNTLAASGTYQCCWDWPVMYTFSATLNLNFSENGFTGTRRLVSTASSDPPRCVGATLTDSLRGIRN